MNSHQKKKINDELMTSSTIYKYWAVSVGKSKDI